MLRTPWPIRDGWSSRSVSHTLAGPAASPAWAVRWDAVLDGEAERGQVRVERVARLVARDVERGHPRAAETLDQPHGLQALRLAEMAQRRQDDPRLDAAGRARPRHRVIDDRDDLLAAEPAAGMEQRRKADLGVDHAVAAELRKEIVHDEAQRLLALHQRDVVRRRAQVLGQAPALRRRNEIAGKRLGRDVRGQAPHDLVAQAAVEVQVQLDFGQGVQVHVSLRICA